MIIPLLSLKTVMTPGKKRADRIVDPLIQNSEHVAKLDQHLLGRRFGGLNNYSTDKTCFLEL